MINADSYNYDEIRHKIKTFKNNGRLTVKEVEELVSLLDERHYQPTVLPELDEQ